MEKVNPYESIPERLHNCPNCGGTLQIGRCNMECTSDKCKFCDFLNKCRFSNRSCSTCKYENKDICEEPCMICDITLGNNKWEPKKEASNE